MHRHFASPRALQPHPPSLPEIGNLGSMPLPYNTSHLTCLPVCSDASPDSTPQEAGKKLSRDDILEMLAAGVTPPGIRTDIVDTPPDPAAPPSASRLPPRPKV